MRGLRSEDLLAIMDFLYCGEANVLQENLDAFLALAEELRLKGLTGGIPVTRVSMEVEGGKFDKLTPSSLPLTVCF